MNFLYNEREDRENDKWDKAIKSNIKKIRLNAMDEQEVEHIDLDTVIQLYIDEYKKIRIRV